MIAGKSSPVVYRRVLPLRSRLMNGTLISAVAPAHGRRQDGFNGSIFNFTLTSIAKYWQQQLTPIFLATIINTPR
jgi:hypothetical protein